MTDTIDVQQGTQGFSIKDSGERQEFSTGSVRDTREGKGRFDLISPIGLERLARHYENGAKKYGDRNWEKGQPVSRFMDSALRHLNRFRLGCRDEDHLIAAVWNLLAIVHVEHQVARGLLPGDLLDWPQPYEPELKRFIERHAFVLPSTADRARPDGSKLEFEDGRF